MNICIATMMKNEADSLIEWVCYHLAIGVDSFIVANNESSDSTEEILNLLSEFCDLKYFNFETPESSRPQLPAFNYMLDKYKSQSDLMAFIDADEFLYPTDGQDEIKSLLGDIFSRQDVGALAINWCNYGSSNEVFKEPGLVIERFTHHSLNDFTANHHYKTIFRSNCASGFVNPHHIKTSKKYISCDGVEIVNHPTLGVGLTKEVNWEGIRINHYVIKSLQEYFVGKSLRGNASTQRPVDRKSYFLSYDRNELVTKINAKIIHKTHAKIAALISFSKSKLGYVPNYLQHMEKHISLNSFFHVDVINDECVSCWAINKAGSSYELVIISEDGEKRLLPNVKRPDVVKAILGSEHAECILCGFSYKINKGEVISIKLTNGFIEHDVYSQ